MKSGRFAAMATAIAALVLSAGAVNAAGSPALSIVIPMTALNGSGENGTATIARDGDKVMVTIDIAGEAHGASEPAHVHLGRCPIIKAIPAYNVGPVLDGKASSQVDLTWDEITSGKYVVNVHQSAAELGKYVSCGNIGGSVSPAPLPTEDSGY